VSLQYIVKSNVSFIIDSLFFLSRGGCKSLIIDISETEYLDRVSLASLTNAVNELSMIGIKMKLVVSEDKPRFIYSVGSSIPKVDFFLSMEAALNDFVN
jgi:hypothetical protein